MHPEVNGYTYNSLWTSSILLERRGDHKRNIMTLKIKIALQSAEPLIYSMTSMIVSIVRYPLRAHQSTQRQKSVLIHRF